MHYDHDQYEEDEAMFDGALDSRIEVPVLDLQVGMYVGGLDRPWLHSPYQMQGFPIRSGKDIQQLQSLCRYVYVDKKRSSPGVVARYQAKSNPNAVATEIQEKKGRFSKTVAAITKVFSSKHHCEAARKVERSFQASEHIFDETRTLARKIINDVRVGNSIDTQQAKEAIADCVDHILRNPDALLMFSNIKHKDTYTSEHSVNVAILSVMLGRRMRLPRRQLEEVGLAGLLHDVGKVLTPEEILNKPSRLTNEEFLIMKLHPSQGRDMLDEMEGLNDAVLSVAHSHHERLNGSGYPRGIGENDLNLYSRIVGITDTYDAVTSDRVYGKGRSNLEAYQILRAASGSHYDEKMVSFFLGAIGTYPPGTAVQLKNGYFGVVVRSNIKESMRPLIIILKNSRQRPIQPRYIDTAGSKPGFQIARVVVANDYDIDVHMFRNRGFRDSLTD